MLLAAPARAVRATELFDVGAIRAAHPIADTVASAGVQLRRSGRRFIARCPFHEDRDPSLVVYPETASYFCFGCNAGGDVIDFVRRLHRLDFTAAVALLSSTTPRGPSTRVTPFEQTARERTPTAIEAAVIETAASVYERQFRRSRSARSYLESRGIDRRTASDLRLGYAGGGLFRELWRHRLDPDAARSLGLLSGERDTFRERIVIPDLDSEGRARWLTGRALGNETPRYLNLRLPSPLLGLSRVAERTAAVVVTEGPFDWLTASRWGMRAVALAGTHVTRHAFRALLRFRRVYLALDADDAGRRAAADLASQLRDRALIVSLPAGVHDLNELGQRRDGRDAFLNSLHEARKGIEDSWPKQTQRERSGRAA